VRVFTTFDFYRNQFGGFLVPETRFNSIVRRASAEIERITFGRIYGESDFPDNVQFATCAVCDAIFSRFDVDGAEMPQLQREKLEQHEKQFVAMEYRGIAQVAYEAATLYLWRSGLLSAVIDFREV